MTVCTATSLPNDTRFKEALKVARELGGTTAEGGEARVKLALHIGEWGHNGTINLDKDSNKKDAIDTIYDEYLKGFSKKATIDHTPQGMSANKSKFRAILKASMKSSCDFPVTAETLLRVRKEEDEAGQKVKPPVDALVSAARVQQEQDDNLSDEQVRECVLKGDPKEKTVEGQAKRAAKIVDGLVTGDAGLGIITHPDLVAASEHLNAFLNTFVADRERDEALAVIAKMGWSVVEPTAEVA